MRVDDLARVDEVYMDGFFDDLKGDMALCKDSWSSEKDVHDIQLKLCYEFTETLSEMDKTYPELSKIASKLMQVRKYNESR